MLKSEFFLENLIDLFDESEILLRYGSSSDMSLRDILEFNSDIEMSEKRELFIAGVDLLEARSILRLLGSEDANLIGKVDIGKLRGVFQQFRDLLDELLSESGLVRDYRPNFEIINKLRVINSSNESKKSLQVLEGGKV